MEPRASGVFKGKSTFGQYSEVVPMTGMLEELSDGSMTEMTHTHQSSEQNWL